MRTLLLVVAVLCGGPGLFLLYTVYSAQAVDATLHSRRLDVGLGFGKRGGKILTYDASLQFKGANGQEYTWQQQLPMSRVQEVLTFFESYPMGGKTKIYPVKNDVLLRRGLPDWRYGVGWGLVVFGLAFGFFYLASAMVSFNGPWLLRPQRLAVLMGLPPLLFGLNYYKTIQEKMNSWPRVTVRVERTLTLDLLAKGGPDVKVTPEAREHLKEAETETIRYQYKGREYMYPADHDVSAWIADANPTFEKAVDPNDPTALTDIPEQGDDSFTGAYIALGLGGVFVLLGLLVP